MINISKFYNKLGFSLDNDKGTSQQFFISTFGKISLESVFLENRKIIEKYNEKLKYLKKHERDLSRNGSELISIVLKEMSTVPNEDKTIKEIILSCCDDKYAFLGDIKVGFWDSGYELSWEGELIVGRLNAFGYDAEVKYEYHYIANSSYLKLKVLVWNM